MDRGITGQIIRKAKNQCTLEAQNGPQTIIVRQLIGEQEEQKVLDIRVDIPDKNPAIEQIVDVYSKEVKINSVDIITDKVIVRGELEFKAIFLAALPNLPVHAVEIKNYKWTQDVDLPGARKGMDADASVVVEFIDYDVEEHTRAYKYKNYEVSYDGEDCGEANNNVCRKFYVSVVLKTIAKVITDREVQICSVTRPDIPKG